jgi:hypothetical protein
MTSYNEDLGVENVGFVMDGGFGSTANFKYMIDKGYDFVMGVDIIHKTTREAVEAWREGLAKHLRLRVAKGVYGEVTRGRFHGAKSNMRVLYSPGLAGDHSEELIRLSESKEGKLARL